jgi:aspartyl protease
MRDAILMARPARPVAAARARSFRRETRRRDAHMVRTGEHRVRNALSPSELSRRRLAAFLGLAIAAPSSATAGSAIVNRQARASRIRPSGIGSDSVYLPPADLKASMDLFRRMTAQVTINGKGPFRFVVDTGANQSVVSTEIAAEIGLPVGEPGPLHGVAGVQIVQTTTADTIRVGGLQQDGMKLSVLPQAAIGGHGFLGLDLIGRQRLTLDFKGQRVVVAPSESQRRDPHDIILPATYRSGQLTLVNGEIAKVPVSAFLDSGAQTSIGNLALKRMAAQRHPALRWTATEVISATGQTIVGDWAVLPSFKFGRMRLEYLPVVFAELHTFEIWKLNASPAILIGVDVMSQFEMVSLDFERNEVRFVVPLGF